MTSEPQAEPGSEDRGRGPGRPAAALPSRPLAATWPVLVSLVLATGYVVALRLPLIDDAYIALCYARTLGETGTWGMFPGHTSNTATSPLNVLLLAALGKLLGSYALAAHVLAGVCLHVVFVAGAAVGRRVLDSPLLGLLAVVAVGANPLLLSTVGLEGPLVAAVTALALRYLIEERWTALGAALGVLVLARLDALPLAPCMLVAAIRAGGSWRSVVRGWATVVVPWFSIAWLLGGAFPDTLFLKTVQVWSQGTVSFLDGPGLYFTTYPLAVGASFLLLPAVPFALLGGPALRRASAALLCHAGASLVVYAFMDPPPYHWYFLQQVLPVALVGALGVGEAARRHGRLVLLAGAAPAVALAVLLVLRGVPPEEPFIHSNWGTEAQYAEIGHGLAARVPPGEAVAFRTEPGTIAFYSERLCVDEFGDRALADRVLADTHSLRGPLMRLLMRASMLFRSPTPAPVATQWSMTPEAGPAADPASGSDWNISTRWHHQGHVRLRPQRR